MELVKKLPKIVQTFIEFKTTVFYFGKAINKYIQNGYINIILMKNVKKYFTFELVKQKSEELYYY